MKEKRAPTTQWFDCDPVKDDVVVFYSRDFGGKKIAIIPKDRFELSETPSAFILTLKDELK